MTSAGHPTTLAGWGQYPRVSCLLTRPETRAQLLRDRDPKGSVARGLGRSYGDPAVNEGGQVIDINGLDRYLDWDPSTAELRVEAGVSLAQIIADFAPRGFFPPITPGTKFVTIGGCIANDIHGKAHHVDGCFANCVKSMRVLLAGGEIVECSREQNSDLYWGTFGGMGLLGIVLDATIVLRPIETTYFRQEAISVANLDELIEAFETYDARYPYSVAWIDPLATGKTLGRGVLTVGEQLPLAELPKRLQKNPLVVAPPSKLSVPFEMPGFALNDLTVRILNVVLEQVQAGGRPVAHYEKFFFPLDFVGEWNRGYGPKGFTQYQFVIPLENGPENMRRILEKIAKSDQVPFLNVLKKFGKEHGLLSFPFEGYTFAIDFPIRDGLDRLVREIDEMVMAAGGRIYLGKDAFCDASTLRTMYPRLGEWLELKKKFDPNNEFTSNLGRRVGLCD